MPKSKWDYQFETEGVKQINKNLQKHDYGLKLKSDIFNRCGKGAHTRCWCLVKEWKPRGYCCSKGKYFTPSRFICETKQYDGNIIQLAKVKEKKKRIAYKATDNEVDRADFYLEEELLKQPILVLPWWQRKHLF